MQDGRVSGAPDSEFNGHSPDSSMITYFITHDPNDMVPANFLSLVARNQAHCWHTAGSKEVDFPEVRQAAD